MVYGEYLIWAKKVQDRGEKAYGELGATPSPTRLSGARGALAEVKLALELADKVEAAVRALGLEHADSTVDAVVTVSVGVAAVAVARVRARERKSLSP